jgi:hypothetical protein
MREVVSDHSSDLVVSLNEIGISEQYGRKLMKVGVQLTFAGQTTRRGISQNAKQVSIISCMCTGTACLGPYMIASQGTELGQLHLEETDTRFGSHLIVQHRWKPYLNCACFVDYIESVFLSLLADFRRNEK